MADERPQYYENTLVPLPVNKTNLSNSLHELRAAVRKGAELIHTNDALPEKWGVEGMFKHFPGIALAFLRLDYQSSVLADDDIPSPNYRQHAFQRIPAEFPGTPLIASRLSPAGSFSPLTAVSLRVLAAVAKTNWGPCARVSLPQEDVDCLCDAMSLALKNGPLVPHDGRSMGGDEMLFGRAGLLWNLLNIRVHQFDGKTQEALTPVMAKIPDLVGAIVDAGRQGSKDYIDKHGSQDAHPLMYAWMEGYYCFGAVHGITGILPILLACNPEELSGHLPVIGETITALCRLTVSSNGHLPMALPSFSYGQPSELVQLCHGSPGILILMAATLKNASLVQDYWCPEWDQAIFLASGRIWDEGILSKGGSLCHGIAGNGWPWLMLHDVFEYHSKEIDNARRHYLQSNPRSSMPDHDVSQQLTSDFFLSRALAFLLHARETRPYNTSPATSDKEYRMPDDPYSMFEGLAGNVCAWADTCAVLQARLRKMEVPAVMEDSIFQRAMQSRLGFPLIGGNGAVGLL